MRGREGGRSAKVFVRSSGISCAPYSYLEFNFRAARLLTCHQGTYLARFCIFRRSVGRRPRARSGTSLG